MASYTSQSIDRVREADIVKTIENFEDLKREGSNYKCLSPFKSEKTASFVVSPAKQMFKCFATGIGGDGIKYVMAKKGVEFIEAIEIIASIHNIYLEEEEVTEDVKRKREQKAEMYDLLEQVSKKYVSTLKKQPKDHWSKKMIKDRDFNPETLIDFQIGFAPINNEVQKWSVERGIFGVAKDVGLCDSKQDMSYDVFKDRLIFPIINHKGTVVGFGGRRSNDEAVSKYPKYINSKESIVYNKSEILYGLFQAKQEISKRGTAILTEGYTDVISMYQNGCENTIASCGTALTNEHAQLIKKYANEIIILRDGDAAGHNATIKDIDVCLANGLQVSLCMLPEGEDPDTLARKEKASTAKWIEANKKDAVLWKVSNYDIKRDQYQRDVDRINETLAINIKSIKDEMHSDAHLQSLSGEALKEAKAFNTSKREEINELTKAARTEIKDLPEIDSHKKSRCVDDICQTLFYIKKDVKRSEYIKQISKLFNVTTGTLKTQIGNLEKQETEKRKNKIGVVNTANLRLPKGASKEEYLEHGFVTVENSYFFQYTNSEGFFQGTNFKIQPLFHIQGDKENKRLCEITNVMNKKKLIDFDSDMLASFGEFRKYLFRIGGYRFFTHKGVNTKHFDEFVNRFDDEFQPALELLTMGWNRKGFFAFADGVYWQDKFRPVNKYGIMHLDGIDTSKNEYNQRIDYYYSPAFSVMYADNQEGDDKYENDRFFVYKKAPISLEQWMNQMNIVFKDKAIRGILFNFGSLFRDIFLSNYDSFPLLGGFGEKDSGKSAFGKILQNFFYYRLPALDLTQATHVGFSRRLSRNHNTVQFLDEYQDKQCDEKIFSGMMGAWNGIGREKGMNSGDKRTQYDKINSAIYYCGQFMPTRMENALATRTVSYFFKTGNFTPEEKSEFHKLLDWTNEGVSSLVVDVVQHRAYFEDNVSRVHAETVRTLKAELRDQDYQERIFGNAAMLFTTYKVLKDKIEFPFAEAVVLEHIKKLILENSEQISDSNGLTVFWSIVQFLFENSIINNELHFKIEKTAAFKILAEKQKFIEYSNSDGKKILFFRLNSIYQYYNKEITKREGIEVIGETTIRQYFKSRPYFIGLVKSKRFGKAGSASCYAFDYDAMVKLGLINLEEDLSPDQELPFGSVSDTNAEDNEDELDF